MWGIGAAALVLGGVGWGLFEPEWIRPVTYRVPLPGLPSAFEGFTILHLSDLHGRVGVFASSAFRAWSAVADLVVVTGDLYHPGWPRARLAGQLGRITGQNPVYFVSGNHDYAKGRLHVEPWHPGESLLDNRVVAIRRGEAVLWLAGVPDLIKGKPDLPGVVRAMGEGPAILLSHRPDGARLAEAPRFGLTLAGHTHGGQVVIPGWGAPLKHNRIGGGYVAGPLALEGGRWLITSRGLGTSELPIRFWCRPELVRIILTKEGSGRQ